MYAPSCFLLGSGRTRELNGVGTKAVVLHCPEDVSAEPVRGKYAKYLPFGAHRRSLTSSPCFFSWGLSSFHRSSHVSTLTFVSADRPMDLRKS